MAQSIANDKIEVVDEDVGNPASRSQISQKDDQGGSSPGEEVSDASVEQGIPESIESVEPVEETTNTSSDERQKDRKTSREEEKFLRRRRDHGRLEDHGGPKAQGKVIKDKTVIIVVAGKPHSGKSRALNNIFFMDFVSRSSAYSVTNTIDSRRLRRDGYEFIVVDTPGLGATDKPIDEVRRDIENVIGELSYTLVYCHSVSPASSITDTDKLVLENLHEALGKRVWQKSVILFTFSDTLRSGPCRKIEERDDYRHILREHAERLTVMLKKECGDDMPRVECVFDAEEDERVNRKDVIAAVPVGLEYKEEKEKHKLIPKGPRGHENWKDRAFVEVLKKSEPQDRVKLLSVTHGVATVTSAYLGGTIGALLGGVGGALVGAIISFGIASIPMAAGGAVAGGAVGSVGAAAVSHAIVAKNTLTQNEKFDRLKEKRLVHLPESEESGHTDEAETSPPSDLNHKKRSIGDLSCLEEEAGPENG